MTTDNKFTQGLFKAHDKLRRLEDKLITTMNLNDSGYVDAAYYKSLEVHEIAEELALTTRDLPVLTGVRGAEIEVKKTIKKTIPVEVGFTKEGWFCVRMFALLPRKERGGVNYIRSSLYPVMRDFFKGKPPVLYDECVLIYRHVYDKSRPQRRKRDYENIEMNQVSDIIALYVLADDGPDFCNLYHCSAEGTEDRCEVFVVPQKDFQKWLDGEPEMPEDGVQLYPNTT